MQARVDLNILKRDPAERQKISSYHPNDRIEIRRTYLMKGGQGGGKAFVTKGFNQWDKQYQLQTHVGNIGSVYNLCLRASELLMKLNQSIVTALAVQSKEIDNIFYTRDYYFVVMMKVRGLQIDEIFVNFYNFWLITMKIILSNAPRNQQMVSPKVQKDLVSAAAKEMIKAIIKVLNNDVFGILVDEFRDISKKEQMEITFRFVDKEGTIRKQFLGITHVKNTCSSTLKEGINLVLSEHGLSISNIRGQGYDGASNMQGEFNGLKTMIMRENSSANYVHCFTHELQLTLVAVAKNHPEIACFFNWTELNNRFNEKNLEFLRSIACFSPLDSFHAFDLDRLVMLELEHKFKIYISDMRDDDRFANFGTTHGNSYSGESFFSNEYRKEKIAK
ncbi:uncharacterized protein LOC130828655 [Amaranthus tricolor]|uniref:uncharacterized protein LOC130828655 n=1 Tax=Amaranthus tricolor TaxID=29722 RepID=UPI0025905783|nr:uncharacterized protein LOC130828655 [Amaranthus tricolor]